MSYNIFIQSSIYNFSSSQRQKIKEALNSVENPKWHTDENSLDIHIEEDFDRRHITALITQLDEDIISKARVKEAIEKMTQCEEFNDGGEGYGAAFIIYPNDLLKELGLNDEM